jgi:SAM-dependent methyltransferase
VRAEQGIAFAIADAYSLPFRGESFDVVHAHQVLQYLAEPIRALREWRRVAGPNGMVAARDADYGAMVWFPAVLGLEEWRRLYRRVARALGGEPDAGRHLVGWAREAGFARVLAWASAWWFAAPEDRAWWAGTRAERVLTSSFADAARREAGATKADLEQLAGAWHEWAAHDGATFIVPHVEVRCRG